MGQSIVAAAKHAGINETTAHRWLKDPVIQAERTRREAALAEVEKAEIERIMTSGYAAVHHRIEALDRLARQMEEPYVNELNGRVYHLRNSPEHIREWRGLLSDIADELGQRIKQIKQDSKVSVEVTGAKDALFNKIAAHATKADDQRTES